MAAGMEERIANAVSTSVSGMKCSDDIDEAVVEYLVASAGEVMEGYEGQRGRLDEAIETLQQELGPLLESVGVEDEAEILGLCDAVARAGIFGESGNGDASESGGGEEEEASAPPCLELRRIILAYAGRVLLKSSDLILERSHRYGLVGPNGAGKTTLLNKLAAGDFMGFPSELSIVYIQHEVVGADDISCVDYLAKEALPSKDIEEVVGVLSELGFTPEMQAGSVSELSGGWRMQLAIGRTMLAKADLLMLDEPTNHLDRNAVKWLVDYLKKQSDTTILFVSHDAEFLEDVSTDIIFLNQAHLDYHSGSFTDFRKAVPNFRLHTNIEKEENCGADSSDASYLSLNQEEKNAGGPLLRFPEPGPLENIKSRNKVVMKGVHIRYRYEGSERLVLTDAGVRVTLSSRVALIGANGAGKTTLIKILIGELIPQEGELWRHQSLRISYIAQHSMHHLGKNLDATPLEYIQNRFFSGRDKEAAEKVTLKLTDEEEEIRKQRGNVGDIVGRRIRGSQIEYECRKVGRKPHDTVWEPLVFIKKMDPYVMKLALHYDEKMKAMQARTELRGISFEYIQMHLNMYGIGPDLSREKIKRMSGGQRSRLVIAAAMWTKPHVLVLDEPTNFLDNETMLALVDALRSFKGGVLFISHNEQFVQNVCNEKWLVQDGTVATVPIH